MPALGKKEITNILTKSGIDEVLGAPGSFGAALLQTDKGLELELRAMNQDPSIRLDLIIPAIISYTQNTDSHQFKAVIDDKLVSIKLEKKGFYFKPAVAVAQQQYDLGA